MVIDREVRYRQGGAGMDGVAVLPLHCHCPGRQATHSIGGNMVQSQFKISQGVTLAPFDQARGGRRVSKLPHNYSYQSAADSARGDYN